MKRIKFFVLAFVLATAIILILDYCFNPDPDDILVEAHGMLFDIALFGVILTLYEYFLQKQEKLDLYLEELEDFRGWDEKEAMYRNVGLIKRILSQKKSLKLHITSSYLVGAKWNHQKFEKVYFNSVNLSKSQMVDCELLECQFLNCHFLATFLSKNTVHQTRFLNCYFDHSSILTENYSDHLTARLKNKTITPANQEFTNVKFNNCSFNFLTLQGELLFNECHFADANFFPIFFSDHKSRVVFLNCTMENVVIWDEQEPHFKVITNGSERLKLVNRFEMTERLNEENEVMRKHLRLSKIPSLIRKPKSVVENDFLSSLRLWSVDFRNTCLVDI